VHALVYGPKSVDKRDMLARLLEDEGVQGYAVVTRHVAAGDMPTWTYIAQRHVERSNPNAVLVVDRAHEALASRPRSMLHLFDLDDAELVHDDDPERASDEGLTGSRVRCVWITDRARQLSERNLGAFLFHCEAFPGSRAERRARVAQVISDFGLSSRLERDLAKYSLLGEQQVRQAAELARQKLETDPPRIASLRDRLEETILAHIPLATRNGDRDRRLPTTSNVRFDHIEGEGFVIAMDLRGVACSTGAACSSGSLEASHVLSAIGLTKAQARSSIRFSLGRMTTADDIDGALEVLPSVVEHLRSISPHYSSRQFSVVSHQ